MSGENGGEDRLAPVIPLFGAGTASREQPRGRSSSSDLDGEPSERHPARGTAARAGAGPAPAEEASTAQTSTSRAGNQQSAAPRLRALREPGEVHDEGAADSVDPAELVAHATEALVRKLRARSLSVSEATTFLRGQQLSSVQIDEIIDEFLLRKYLDDRLLAGHLVLSGHERKGQGRIALGRVLSQRGIPRDVADEALAELPDDDFERALEFARGKMRSMSRLDTETAKRRLSGQLARRGYSGSLASQVIRQAMQEQTFGGSSSGVRFE